MSIRAVIFDMGGVLLRDMDKAPRRRLAAWAVGYAAVSLLMLATSTYAAYAGGILIVFFIARLLTGRALAGLLAAGIFALIPHNLTTEQAGPMPVDAFLARAQEDITKGI